MAVAAGSLALPTLLKLATLMAGQNQDFLTCNQLPVVSSRTLSPRCSYEGTSQQTQLLPTGHHAGCDVNAKGNDLCSLSLTLAGTVSHC